MCGEMDSIELREISELKAAHLGRAGLSVQRGGRAYLAHAEELRKCCLLREKSSDFFERSERDPVYLRVVNIVHRDGDVCSSYGLLGVRSLEPPRKGRLSFLQGATTAMEPMQRRELFRHLAERRRSTSCNVGVTSSGDPSHSLRMTSWMRDEAAISLDGFVAGVLATTVRSCGPKIEPAALTGRRVVCSMIHHAAIVKTSWDLRSVNVRGVDQERIAGHGNLAGELEAVGAVGAAAVDPPVAKVIDLADAEAEHLFAAEVRD